MTGEIQDTVLLGHLKEFRGRPVGSAILRGFANGLYILRFDGRGFVTPSSANIGEYGCNLLVRQGVAPGDHGVVPWCAFDLDGTSEAVKHNTNGALGVGRVYPF